MQPDPKEALCEIFILTRRFVSMRCLVQSR